MSRVEDALATQVRTISARNKEVCGYIIDAVLETIKACREDHSIITLVDSGQILAQCERLVDIAQKGTNRVLMAVDSADASLTKLISTLVQSKVDTFDLVNAGAVVPPEYLPEDYGGGLVHVEYNKGVYIPGCADIHTQQAPIDLSVTAPDMYSTTVQQKRTPVYNTQTSMRKNEQARKQKGSSQASQTE